MPIKAFALDRIGSARPDYQHPTEDQFRPASKVPSTFPFLYSFLIHPVLSNSFQNLKRVRNISVN